MTYPQQESGLQSGRGIPEGGLRGSRVELRDSVPRMTTTKRCRIWRDKPPAPAAMVDVKEAFTPERCRTLVSRRTCRFFRAIRIPKVGELSRKERDEIKPLFGIVKMRSLRRFKRLENPGRIAVRKIKEFGANTLLMVHPGTGGEEPAVDR